MFLVFIFIFRPTADLRCWHCQGLESDLQCQVVQGPEKQLVTMDRRTFRERTETVQKNDLMSYTVYS